MRVETNRPMPEQDDNKMPKSFRQFVLQVTKIRLHINIINTFIFYIITGKSDIICMKSVAFAIRADFAFYCFRFIVKYDVGD